MNYEDDESIEEKSFKVNGSDEDEIYDDVDDPLEPGLDDGVSFGKEEVEEVEEKETY